MDPLLWEYCLLDGDQSHLTPVIQDNGDDLISSAVKKFFSGDLQNVFAMEFAVKLLSSLRPDEDENLEATLLKRAELFLKSSILGEWDREFLIVLLGAASLQQFVQINWTGPPVPEAQSNDIPLFYEQEDLVRSYLAPNEETIYFKVAHPEYLLVARLFLCNLRSFLGHCATASRWCLRYIRIHQQVIEERSPSLHSIMLKELEIAFQRESPNSEHRCKQFVQLHLEAFWVCLLFYESQKAKEYLHKARDLSGLNLNFIGALGKRTQHQLREIAQLTLRVEKSTSSNKSNENSASVEKVNNEINQEDFFPKDLKLNDDVRLEKIKFSEDDALALPKMTVEDQAVVLGFYLYERKMNARHELMDEELMSYLTCILSSPRCWPIQTVSLLQRSKMEALHHRSMGRSMMQIQALIDHCQSSYPAAKCRLTHFFSTSLPPQWIMEKELAALLQRQGANGSALEIYLRLHMWEEVISMYHLMQRRNKAEAVVREQLAIKETPTLWCHLGDATDNIEHYRKAWELSNHRSSRAQRSLGMYHFRRKEYDQSVPFLEKSVEVNPVQVDAWFSLAYAAKQIKNWNLAAKAYRRCINIEPDAFEAWNNLADAYVNTGQKVRAWHALREALRCSFDNWRVWQNYLLVSTDIGSFSEVIKAYHRILDLKEKYVDAEVLGILVKAVSTALLDCDGKPASALFSKSSELFGRLTSQVTSDSQVWKHYGRLIGSREDPSLEDLQRVVQYLQKSHRFATFDGNWVVDAVTRRDVLELSLELANGERCHEMRVEGVPGEGTFLRSSEISE